MILRNAFIKSVDHRSHGNTVAPKDCVWGIVWGIVAKEILRSRQS